MTNIPNHIIIVGQTLDINLCGIYIYIYIERERVMVETTFLCYN
jgi:hypothetical protein